MSGRHAQPRAGHLSRGKVLALLSAMLVALTLLVPAPEQTEASWTDGENAKATFTATSVPAPIIRSCTAASLLSKTTTVKWEMPTNSTYSANDITTSGGQDLLGLGLGIGLIAGGSTTGPDGSGIFTTKYSEGVLGGLLGLSGPFYLGIYGTPPTTGWSSPLSVVKATPNLLGLTTKCEVIQNG